MKDLIIKESEFKEAEKYIQGYMNHLISACNDFIKAGMNVLEEGIVAGELKAPLLVELSTLTSLGSLGSDTVSFLNTNISDFIKVIDEKDETLY